MNTISTASTQRWAGAASVAMPSVGCGVNGWAAPAAARAALDAVDAWVSCTTDHAAGGTANSTLGRVDFVLRGAREHAAWRACAHERFGECAHTERDEGGQLVECWRLGEG